MWSRQLLRAQFSLFTLLSLVSLLAVLVGVPLSVSRAVEISLLPLYLTLFGAVVPSSVGLVLLRRRVASPSDFADLLVATGSGLSAMLLLCLAINPNSMVDLVVAPSIGAAAGILTVCCQRTLQFRLH